MSGFHDVACTFTFLWLFRVSRNNDHDARSKQSSASKQIQWKRFLALHDVVNCWIRDCRFLATCLEHLLCLSWGTKFCLGVNIVHVELHSWIYSSVSWGCGAIGGNIDSGSLARSLAISRHNCKRTSPNENRMCTMGTTLGPLPGSGLVWQCSSGHILDVLTSKDHTIMHLLCFLHFWCTFWHSIRSQTHSGKGNTQADTLLISLP